MTIESGTSALAGASVGLRWSAKTGTGNISCQTSSAGSCSTAVTLSSKADAVTFTVTSVAKDGYVYDVGANEAPTSVTVGRPR